MLHHLAILAGTSLFLWLFSGPAASAAPAEANAPEYSARVWETEDGLPESAIISMVQTRDGYLWLGTANGLVRFDGVRFAVFNEGNTPGLGGSPIMMLFEDSRRQLWIGTKRDGTYVMKEGRVSRPAGLALGNAEESVVAACEDGAGAVWLLQTNGGVWQYLSGQAPTPFYLPLPASGRPHSILQEKNGPLWIGTERLQLALGETGNSGSLELPVRFEQPVSGQLDLLVPGQAAGYWRFANNRVQRWVTNRLEQDLGPYLWPASPGMLTSACEDREGNLFVGTLGLGVFWYGTNGTVLQLSTTGVRLFDEDGATNLTTARVLSHDFILSLVVDREGTLWVGTDGGGLNRVKRHVFRTLEPTRDWAVQTVASDGAGGLWIGANDIGLNIAKPVLGHWRDGAMTAFSVRDGLPSRMIETVLVDSRDRLWVGTYFEGLLEPRGGRFEPVATDTSHSFIHCLFEDRRQVLWVGTQTGLLRKNDEGWELFTTSNGLSADNISAIRDDNEGNVWIGTRGGGLNRWRDGRFTAFRKDDGLPSDDISSLWVDGENVLWVGTFAHGFARQQAGRWIRYTTAEGLISDRISFLIEDGEGSFWIGSESGVMRAQKAALNDFAGGTRRLVPVRAYGKADGLPSPVCTSGSQPAACQTADGRLWFSTLKGVAVIDPAEIHLNTNPPPVVIVSVLVDDEPVRRAQAADGVPESITLRPGDERLEIHYSSLNLSAPERARFRYRLEGHETEWTEAGDARVARYPRLPPGEYEFRVLASNEDGVWNEVGRTLGLVVLPPFWRTWWFITLSSAAILAVMAGLVHLISTQRLQRQVAVLREQEALERDRARIARDIHDQLGANLTQMALLGELVEADKHLPEEIESHARQISQTARETTRALDEIVWTVNPSNDTLEGLVNYICKYAQDYLSVAGLRYRLEVPPHLPVASIAPEVRHNVFLAAKESITNVVRHAKASAAWVRLHLQSGGFTLEIEDNGRGLEGMDAKAAQQRSGLKNMRKRMEEIGGSFHLGAGPEGGTLVQLTVPLRKDEVDASKEAG